MLVTVTVIVGGLLTERHIGFEPRQPLAVFQFGLGFNEQSCLRVCATLGNRRDRTRNFACQSLAVNRGSMRPQATFVVLKLNSGGPH